MTEYSLYFRATVRVEPFRVQREVRVNRENKTIEVEVDTLQISVDASDPRQDSFTTNAYRTKKNGERYAVSEYWVIAWEELPEQAKQVVRDAYIAAVRNVKRRWDAGLMVPVRLNDGRP